MQYGYFDDTSREYVITTPETPYPWINYLGTNDFFSLISNTAGGYSFYKDALYRRITRYRYNNVPIDSGGRYFYINDNDTLWSPGWKPVKTKLDKYECRHGMGYTRITGEKNNLEADVLFFVPEDSPVEIQKVKLTNNGNEKKNFTFHSFTEFALWNALEDMTNFQRNYSTGEVEVKDGVIYHKTEYRERRNHYSFYGVNSTPDGFDTDRDTFVGLYNGFENPQLAVEGRAENSIADGWSPVASHFFQLELEPGESKELIFYLGYIEIPEADKWESKGIINKKPAVALMEKFNTPAKVDEHFNILKSHWNEVLSHYTIESGDNKLNRMINIWNQYQCIVTYNLSRSASYFESGIGRGIGFRDTNQDLLGCVHQIPKKAKERILDVAATQLADGGAFHQYQPLTKKGNDAIGGDFNDDPLWLILSTSAYIKETGDWDILNKVVDFENDSKLAGTMEEHLRRSFAHVLNNKGPHDLPLIGRADWNDCLNLNCFSTDSNDSFQTSGSKDGRVAESVMIAGLFLFVGIEWVSILERRGLAEEAETAKIELDKMEKAVKTHGWDGEWYIRAYDDAGDPVGSSKNEEGKIFIESQGFCSMAEVGKDDGMPLKALDSAKKYLDTPYGLVLLNPPYQEYKLNLGEISTYIPGYKENAGIFCHNNPWIIIGETIAGRGNMAWDYYSKIAPAWVEPISEIHKTEPYVYSQMIAGKDARRHGEAKNSWLTGTAAWNFVAVSQWILGIRPDYDGLRLDPCLPDHLNEFVVNRKFRGAGYKITIKGKGRGIKSAVIDGKMLDISEDGSALIPFADFKGQHEVMVEMID